MSKPASAVKGTSLRNGKHLQVGAHDVAHAADIGILPQVVHRAAPCSQALPECLNGYIQANLIAVFETVGNGLGRGIHMHGHPFDLVFLGPRCKCGTGEAHDAQWRVLQAWSPGFLAYRQPDFKWRLGRKVMKTSGGQQTDHALRYTFAGFRKGMVFRGTAPRQNIQPPTDPLQLARGTETTQVSSGNTVGVQLPRAQDVRFPDNKTTRNLYAIKALEM